TLTLGTLAGISLVMRSSLIDVMTEDFVTTAKAKGLSDRQVLRRHILPSGLPPMVTLIALDIAFVIGGAYQVEVVFNYYGIGWETIQAIDNLDFPLLQFIIVVGGVAIVLANLVSDFILLLLDPGSRSREGRHGRDRCGGPIGRRLPVPSLPPGRPPSNAGSVGPHPTQPD